MNRSSGRSFARHEPNLSSGGRVTDKFLDEQVVREFIQRYVHHGYLERGRNGKMTGEWIVFAKQDNEAYYLT
jgi:hypothetical protein